MFFAAAPGGPVSVSKTSSTATALTFSWELPCELRHGVIQGFYYQLTDKGETGHVTEGSIDSNLTTAMLDGLHPCTEYVFKIRAWTSAGNGSFSLPVEESTDSQGEGSLHNYY